MKFAAVGYPTGGRAQMRYKPRSIAALQVALGALPGGMQVEVDQDIGMPVRTVAELSQVTAWPENLLVTTPQERHPESAIRVSRVRGAKRLSPKP
jgi:hypothetical protein